MKTEGSHHPLYSVNYFNFTASIFRFAVIGVVSIGHPTKPEAMPDVSAKITPDIKTWIKQIASDTKDSNC